MTCTQHSQSNCRQQIIFCTTVAQLYFAALALDQQERKQHTLQTIPVSLPPLLTMSAYTTVAVGLENHPTQEHQPTLQPWKAAVLKACSSVGASNLNHSEAQHCGTHNLPTSSAGDQRRHSLSSIPEGSESDSSDTNTSLKLVEPSTQPCTDLPVSDVCQDLQLLPALPGDAPLLLAHSGDSVGLTDQWVDDVTVLNDRRYFDILAEEFDCCLSMGLSIRKCNRRCTYHNRRRPNRW